MAEDEGRRRERARSQIVHVREAELVPRDRRRLTRRQKIVTGVVIGSFFYLVASCFTEHQLHQPKIDRTRFKFNHNVD
jgi:hypothetical protein